MMDDDDYKPKPTELKVNEALRLCRDTTDIDVIIELTKHQHPQVRQVALREMCPCRVKKDLSDFWNRVFEMLADDAENVRYQVLHTLCDGSPSHLEERIAEALEHFNRDPSTKIRRQAHRALTAYRRTGKWNIL
ncbi:uncharacterized protein LOC101846602 isoform X5 [Aplysia californica]|uniref:Uncharacterized protein LOC101846602 isoform X1 n=1 Tax=Aplysia californica TaxID=6500 RepID=A0ABM1VZF5_APLCA|nr:uncharacterized protein LOC101846602 isoform X1 [Aplysia californica]XP_035827796.1 uncharacterized protein LOC101846602 isoform X2 [Aplysia californica]XP_035827797.1 uncharacterized protein LOC101846602 isoform X3 [Aplysia californica]XP_035827798.1 uncharacterized protein LOC101846602 isoform X4 [Aplysia californica]XP_035827799.1 uncharacterized protein LOC101846602 isoform X5 [Aplysia californica]